MTSISARMRLISPLARYRSSVPRSTTTMPSASSMPSLAKRCRSGRPRGAPALDVQRRARRPGPAAPATGGLVVRGRPGPGRGGPSGGPRGAGSRPAPTGGGCRGKARASAASTSRRGRRWRGHRAVSPAVASMPPGPTRRAAGPAAPPDPRAGRALAAALRRGAVQVRSGEAGTAGLGIEELVGAAGHRRHPTEVPCASPRPRGGRLVATVSRPGGRGTDRAAGPCRGRSGLRRAGCWLTASRGDPQDSATERKPPMAGLRARTGKGERVR